MRSPDRVLALARHLALDNDRLRRALEAASKITKIDPASPKR